MIKTLVVIAALVAGSFATANAHADPFITGSLNITGNVTYDYGDNFYFPFDAGTIDSVSTTGGFATLTPTTVAMDNFIFAGASESPAGTEILSSPNGTSYYLLLTSLSAANGISEISCINLPGVTPCVPYNNVSAAGTGVFYATGFAPTTVVFDLTTQGFGNTLNSFSDLVIQTAPAPEPESLALFGTGLLGIVGIARRKFKV